MNHITCNEIISNIGWVQWLLFFISCLDEKRMNINLTSLTLLKFKDTLLLGRRERGVMQELGVRVALHQPHSCLCLASRFLRKPCRACCRHTSWDRKGHSKWPWALWRPAARDTHGQWCSPEERNQGQVGFQSLRCCGSAHAVQAPTSAFQSPQVSPGWNRDTCCPFLTICK